MLACISFWWIVSAAVLFAAKDPPASSQAQQTQGSNTGRISDNTPQSETEQAQRELTVRRGQKDLFARLPVTEQAQRELTVRRGQKDLFARLPVTEEMLTVRQGRQAQLLQTEKELARAKKDVEDTKKENQVLGLENQEQRGIIAQLIEKAEPAKAPTKRVAVAAVVSRYNSVGRPSKFRDSLALLLESILDVNARSEWELVPVALCLKGEENVPEAAVAELEHLGFTVRMEDPVAEEKDIHRGIIKRDGKIANHKYFEEIHKDYGYGGIFRDYLKLRAMQWKEFDRVLVLDSDTMLLEPLDDIFDSAADYQLTTTPDWAMMETINQWPPIQTGFLLFNPVSS
jgi:regulator of replication initiation timing